MRFALYQPFVMNFIDRTREALLTVRGEFYGPFVVSLSNHERSTSLVTSPSSPPSPL
jgi:hypothetical protein